MGEFGRSDDLYSLLTEYKIRPWESWTIEHKVIHAPGTAIHTLYQWYTCTRELVRLATAETYSIGMYYTGACLMLYAFDGNLEIQHGFTVEVHMHSNTCLHEGSWLQL